MKKIYIPFFILLFTFSIAHAQFSRYVVQLKNKNGSPYSLSNPSAYLSAKAIERRNRQKIKIDSTDLPITPAYIDSIKKVPNVQVLNVSKWFNQVLIKTTDAAALARINSFSFVITAAPIAAKLAPVAGSDVNKITRKLETKNENVLLNFLQRNESSQINYGGSQQQITIHNGDYLHNKGFTGKGITIAVLDAGFYQYKTNPAFDSLRQQGRVLGEWDFVAGEQSVNEDDAHGGFCLSIMAANTPGVMVGSAPHASFYLLRTEEAATEYPVEEQNWAAAAEFADSVGVDMISTSLGYSDFDNPVFDHSYADRNGHTTLVTRAANMAARKGILVTASAGNSGSSASDLKYVNCPADADSVLAVGAINTASVVAPFSSWGPNSAGKVKPNVTSVGWNTTFSWMDGTAVQGNGTSFSNPNLAGLIACLWQAFPEFTNMEIINAVQKSASKFSSPDVRMGYGIPDFKTAYGLLENERSKRKFVQILGNERIKAYPVPVVSDLNIAVLPAASGNAYVHVWDAQGRLIENRLVQVISDQPQIIIINKLNQLPAAVYYVEYKDDAFKKTITVVKQY